MMGSNYLTPPKILSALGAFDLDPATTCKMAHEGKPWLTAKTLYCRCSNGLDKAWSGRVWLNPPYERPLTEQFIKKLAEHKNGIALLMARVDSGWFHDLIMPNASAIMFMRRRPHFFNEDGLQMDDRAPTASMLVAFGETCAKRLFEAKIDGKVIYLWDATIRQ